MTIVEFFVIFIAKIIETAVKTIAFSITCVIKIVPFVHQWYKEQKSIKTLILEQNEKLDTIQKSIEKIFNLLNLKKKNILKNDGDPHIITSNISKSF